MKPNDEQHAYVVRTYEEFPAGRDRLFALIQSRGRVDISRRMIAMVLGNMEARQITKKVVRRSVNHVPKILVPFQRIQVDTVHLTGLAGYNSGFAYLLTGIDVFTRFAFVEPLQMATALNVANAVEKWLTQFPAFRTIQTDNGGEFKGEFIEMIKKHPTIRHIYSPPHQPFKNGSIERFNGTIKRLIMNYIKQTGNNRYLDKLPEFVAIHNNIKGSIGYSPMSIMRDKEIQRIVARKQLEHFKQVEARQPRFDPLAVGDSVRIAYNHKEEKVGSSKKLSWSKEIHPVAKVIGENRYLVGGAILTRWQLQKINAGQLIKISEPIRIPSAGGVSTRSRGVKHVEISEPVGKAFRWHSWDGVVVQDTDGVVVFRITGGRARDDFKIPRPEFNEGAFPIILS